MNYERLDEFASAQRNNPSPAELKIKEFLESKGFCWQFVLAPFIADFYNPVLRMVVEVDGKFHDDQKRADHKRSKYLIKRYLCRIVRVPARACFDGRAVPYLTPIIFEREKDVDLRRRNKINTAKGNRTRLKGLKLKHKRKFKRGVSPGSTMSQWSHRAAGKW